MNGLVKDKVAKMAKEHGVSSEPSRLSEFAYTVTLLADDKVEQDETERLLIKLFNQSVISKETLSELLYQHLKEVHNGHGF